MESEKQEEVSVTDSIATSSTPGLVESLTQQVCVYFIDLWLLDIGIEQEITLTRTRERTIQE